MAGRIEDYAVIGNGATAALVGRDGSIDWLGLPRFDSSACFAALLGKPDHGRWLLAPAATDARVTRHYRGNSLVLETLFETAQGAVSIVDFMDQRDGISDVVRIVTGLRGRVSMRTELIVRFEYGSVIPWVSRMNDGRMRLTAGPDMLVLHSDIPVHGEDFRTVGNFDLAAGESVSLTLSWTRSYRPAPDTGAASEALQRAESWWEQWASGFHFQGPWSAAVCRSLLTLKALTHRETGGIVAAATTSLPEKLGGSRNWDYRFCWLRDATFTLYAFIGTGFLGEAKAWRQWLLRAVAGSPDDLQIMYGVAGERRLTEYEVPWLAGYENSAPVRIGNAASTQLQLDVYGEVIDALYVARKAGLEADEPSWELECALVEHLEKIWNQPDEGIWEVRGGRRHFTHSKVMAWVAFDRAVRTIDEFGMQGPRERWCQVRDAIHADVCAHGFNPGMDSFVQYYGATALDASLLLIPMVGFLPPNDPRMRSTLAAIERDLVTDGWVRRYDTEQDTDGLPPGEGAFLACSFWLADNYILQGRLDEARTLFERLLGLCNDVGLLAEEYDPADRRQLGNFPQAFSHLALINTAHNLAGTTGPAHQRSTGSSTTAS